MARFLALWMTALLVALPALAADPVAREMGADRYVFGGNVRIDTAVTGDLIAAGGNVDVDAAVAGDAVVAGGNVRISAKVGHTVYAAGGRLAIDAPVGHNLRVAGGQVDLGSKAEVGGNVTSGGGQVSLRGPIKGSVMIGGGRVTIDAPVAGDVISTAGNIRLGPNARIGGKLQYRSGELDQDPAAQVAGGIERLVVPGGGAGSASKQQREPERWVGPGWLWSLGLVALAMVLVAAAPVLSQRMAALWRTRWGWSLLWGFIVLVCVPVAAAMLVITIIGIPLAVLVVLLYGALLLVGYVASGIALGDWVLGRFVASSNDQRGTRIASAAVAVFVLAVLGSLPYVGGWVAALAVVVGIGAIAQLALPSLRGAAPTAAA